ncbi:hypothetical protein PS9374_07145 [Planomonospora sphaerica]|uniref:Uncharacterized protein n=1 Tax=Planomonospora sphaerica TaxID=161355 RepID=A0A171DQX1_9ACTN|nr:hypothetical protein PS9374_07145 [Planomonospora sphaerica]
MQRPGQQVVPHRLHHLDHTGHTRRRLRVTHVRLDRTQPERPVLRPVLTVGRQQRLRLDRVAERRAGAVRLHRVDLRRSQTRSGQGLPDHPLLRRTVRRGQPVGGAVGVDRRTTHHRQHPVAVAARVRQPLQQEHAHALAPAGAVRARAERLAPAVGGQTALPAHVHERVRGRHDGHPAGQGQPALSPAQGLDRPVEGDQRRRARRVHGHRGALQPQGVGDAAGDHAGEAAVAVVGGDLLGERAQPQAPVVVHHSGEDSGVAALHRGGIDAGPLERLPRDLQQQPLLGVHGLGLTRADPEEVGVEVGRVVQEPALARGAPARPARLGVVEVGGPAPVRRERRDHVGALGDEAPQRVRGGHVTRVAAGHADDRDGFVDRDRGGREGCGAGRRVEDLRADVPGQRGGRRVVEGQRRAQPEPGGGVEPVAQLDRGEGVETDVLERPGGDHGGGSVVAEHGGGLGADELDQRLVPLGLAQPVEPLGEGRPDRGRAGRGRTAGGGPHQVPQQRRDPVRPGGERPQVHPHRHHRRFAAADGPVQEGQVLRGGQQFQAEPLHTAQGGLVEPVPHAAVTGPQAPRHRGGRLPAGGAVHGQRVEEDVGRRVVPLSRPVEDRGGGRVQHERRQVQIRRQLVQVPGRVRLRPEHGVDPLRGQRRDDAVVHDARGVHDAAQRVGRGDVRQEPGERAAVADVAGRRRHPRAQRLQLLAQPGRTRRVRTPPAGQQQVPHPVLGHQVPRHQRAQATRATGHQHRAVRVPDRVRLRLGSGHEGQAGHEDLAAAQRRLRFVRGDGGGQRAPGLLGAVGVDQHEPARVLRLRGPHQTPHRGRPQVHVLTGQRHRAAGHHHQTGVREPLVGQPRLDGGERVRRGRTGARQGVALGYGELEEHRPGYPLRAGDLLQGEGDDGRRGGPGSQAGPPEVERRVVAVPAGGAQVVAGHLTDHEGADRRHRRPGGVGDGDRRLAPARGDDAGAHGRRALRVERHVAPRER